MRYSVSPSASFSINSVFLSIHPGCAMANFAVTLALTSTSPALTGVLGPSEAADSTTTLASAKLSNTGLEATDSLALSNVPTSTPKASA